MVIMICPWDRIGGRLLGTCENRLEKRLADLRIEISYKKRLDILAYELVSETYSRSLI